MLKFKLKNSILTVLQVYAPNELSEYPAFSLKVNAAVKQAAKQGHFAFIGDSNVHMGNFVETRWSVVKRNGSSDPNRKGKLLQNFCRANFIAITNIFFHHKDIHKHTWY